MIKSGATINSVKEKYNLPDIFFTYLACCPPMDLNLRFLPREGGYYDQYYSDMFWFKIIEGRITEEMNREHKRQKQRVKL